MHTLILNACIFGRGAISFSKNRGARPTVEGICLSQGPIKGLAGCQITSG